MGDFSGGGTDISSSGSALDWFKAASPLVGSLIGGGSKAGPMPIVGPSLANQNAMSSFDSSQWTVSTGSASANAGTTPWLLVIGVGLLVLYLRRYAGPQSFLNLN